MGVALFGDLGGGGFAEHGEDEFQVRHVIAEVFLWVGEGFEFFVLGGRHAEGGLADFRSEDGEFPALLDPAIFPLVGEFVADGDAAQALFDPFFGVAFLLVDGPHSFCGELGVFNFLEALVADFGEPTFEGLGLGRGDGLNEAEKLLGIGNVGHPLFAVCGGHFQTVTIRHGFIAFLFEAFLELSPIGSGINTFGENRDDIDDGENPFFLAGVPGAADLFFFKKGDGGHGSGCRGDCRVPTGGRIVPR